jgi:hypothetical protein
MSWCLVGSEMCIRDRADTPDYRRLVQAKLNALGVEPDAAVLSETPK